MKQMFEYDLVRRMYYHENVSRREISRRTGYHRKTINKMLRYSQPPGYRRAGPARGCDCVCRSGGRPVGGAAGRARAARVVPPSRVSRHSDESYPETGARASGGRG